MTAGKESPGFSRGEDVKPRVRRGSAPDEDLTRMADFMDAVYGDGRNRYGTVAVQRAVSSARLILPPIFVAVVAGGLLVSGRLIAQSVVSFAVEVPTVYIVATAAVPGLGAALLYLRSGDDLPRRLVAPVLVGAGTALALAFAEVALWVLPVGLAAAALRRTLRRAPRR